MDGIHPIRKHLLIGSSDYPTRTNSRANFSNDTRAFLIPKVILNQYLIIQPFIRETNLVADNASKWPGFLKVTKKYDLE